MSLPQYSQYKSSGAKWLNDVPFAWDVRRAKFLFEIKKRIASVNGYDILSITQQGIKIKDVESNDGQLSMDYSKYQIVEVGDFAMNHMDLLTGYVDVAQTVGVTSPDYRVFSIKNLEICDSEYFLYLFQNGYKQRIFYAFGQGASQLGRWRLPTEQFKDFIFPLPPLKEQRKIASFLHREIAKIDALILEQEKLLVLLSEKRQATISHTVTKGLSPNVPMKDSGVEWLGNVPEHWKIFPLKTIVAIPITDGPHETPIFLNEGVPFISAAEVSSGNINFERIRAHISYEDHHRFSKKYAPKLHDIFMVKSGATTGVTAIVETESEFSIWSPLAAIRCNQSLAKPFFVLNFLRSHNFLEGVTLNWSFGTQQNIGMGVIGELCVALPPLDEQIEIVNSLNSVLPKITVLTNEANRGIALLKERRNALISAAVTGKIDVRHAVQEQVTIQEAA